MISQSTTTIHDRIADLEAHLEGLGSVIVAYSGGVDSSFLAAVAARALGDKALAVTLATEVEPTGEATRAAELAGQIGIRHRQLEARWLDIEGVDNNPPDRCYRCKKHLFGHLLAVAEAEHAAVVVEGSNRDDDDDYRPGMRAVSELGIQSPLRTLGFTKHEIRAASALLELPTATMPSMACLGSRFPYGASITDEALTRINAAETFLRTLGLGQVRVRDHHPIARIEVAPEVLAEALGMRETIVEQLHAAGYDYVTLDLDGYRTGSMNVGLTRDQVANPSGRNG